MQCIVLAQFSEMRCMLASKKDARKSSSCMPTNTKDAVIPMTKSVPTNRGKLANPLKAEIQSAQRKLRSDKPAALYQLEDKLLTPSAPPEAAAAASRASPKTEIVHGKVEKSKISVPLSSPLLPSILQEQYCRRQSHACTVVQCTGKDDLPFLCEHAFFDPL
jgi:hypothetical protein